MTKITVAGKHHDAMELAQAHFARGIEQRLAQLSAAHTRLQRNGLHSRTHWREPCLP